MDVIELPLVQIYHTVFEGAEASLPANSYIVGDCNILMEELKLFAPLALNLANLLLCHNYIEWPPDIIYVILCNVERSGSLGTRILWQLLIRKLF